MRTFAIHPAAGPDADHWTVWASDYSRTIIPLRGELGTYATKAEAEEVAARWRGLEWHRRT